MTIFKTFILMNYQNTGVGSLSSLQGIFPTQGSNPGLPCCRRILYQLSHQGSPRILEWKPLLQWIFLTQESNWCLQLSYQGSPYVYMCVYTYIYFGCAGFFVAAHRLLLGAVSRGSSLSQRTGFSLWWLLLLWSTGSGCTSFHGCSVWALEHGPSSCGTQA